MIQPEILLAGTGSYLQSPLAMVTDLFDEVEEKVFGRSGILDWCKAGINERKDAEDMVFACPLEDVKRAYGDMMIESYRMLPGGKVFPISYQDYTQFVAEIEGEEFKITLPAASMKPQVLTVIGEIISTDVSVTLEQLSWDEHLTVFNKYQQLRNENPKATDDILFEEAYFQVLEDKGLL